MSNEAKIDTHVVYKALWAVKLQPAAVKLVALAYAKFADPDGSNCYPGRASIMEMTGYGKDYVRDATNFLIDAGVLRIERDATHNLPRRYFIDLQVLRDFAASGKELRAPARSKERRGPGSTRGAGVVVDPSQPGRGARVNEPGGPGATQPTRHQPGHAKGGGGRPPASAGVRPREKNYLKVVSA